MIRLPDDAFEFHPFHQRGGAVVADLQPALNIGGRGLAIAFDDRNRLREQVAAAIAAHDPERAAAAMAQHLSHIKNSTVRTMASYKFGLVEGTSQRPKR